MSFTYMTDIILSEQVLYFSNAVNATGTSEFKFQIRIKQTPPPQKKSIHIGAYITRLFLFEWIFFSSAFLLTRPWCIRVHTHARILWSHYKYRQCYAEQMLLSMYHILHLWIKLVRKTNTSGSNCKLRECADTLSAFMKWMLRKCSHFITVFSLLCSLIAAQGFLAQLLPLSGYMEKSGVVKTHQLLSYTDQLCCKINLFLAFGFW